MPLELVATGDHDWSSQWRSTLELTPGAHQLSASARHPSGFFTTNTSVWFTNNAANETAVHSYDGAGNVTQIVWKNNSGGTNRTQTLSWDARGRLVLVSERDASTNGYDLHLYYDPLGRRGQTHTSLVTNGLAVASPQLNTYSFYDPSVEFLELGLW